MLELAGEIADGVSLWLCSAHYIESHVIPHVRVGRERAGLPLDGFEVVASVPVCVTPEPAAARDAFRRTLAVYAALPFYRRMLDASGFAGELAAGEVSDATVDQLAGIGEPADAAAHVRRYVEAGATLPVVGPFSSPGARGFEEQLEAVAA
jgi:alkanesulfonate monooxygenase SsuD/methylene tetrahydromethanopterin reductase-like flavin-dependent oxidoreductase (luciferase family)